MGNYIFNGAIYLIAIIFLIISFIKSRQKTKKALIKAWNSFKNIIPMLLGVIFLIGLMLSILDTEFISRIIGEKSGALGVLLASVLGSVTLIPGFIAFPTAALLLSWWSRIYSNCCICTNPYDGWNCYSSHGN